MSALDFIKIVGLDGDIGEHDPETFEVFQGLGSTLTAINTATAQQNQSGAGTGSTTLTELPAELSTWITEMIDKINGVNAATKATFAASEEYHDQMQAYELAMDEYEEHHEAHPELPAPTKPIKPDTQGPDLPMILQSLVEAIMLSGGNLALIPFAFLVVYGTHTVVNWLQGLVNRKDRSNPEAQEVILRELLQAVKDLQYNDEELHLPGSDAYVHLTSKFINK